MAICPRGLEYLAQVDQLLIKQKKEGLEVLTNFEMANEYLVLNTTGQMVYNCKEESNVCIRQCLSASRPFVMHVNDGTNTEVIRITRPCKACPSLFSFSECCADRVEVEAPIGQPIGRVMQVYDGCSIRYNILDASGDVILQIHGPSVCHCSCIGQDIKFELMTKDGSTVIGKISKQWANLLQELFTDADNFGVKFPMDLDVKAKALALAAVMLIDFMYFENNEKH